MNRSHWWTSAPDWCYTEIKTRLWLTCKQAHLNTMETGTLVVKSSWNRAHHDLQDLSWGRSEWTLILLWYGYFSLLDFPQKEACQQKKMQMVCFTAITSGVSDLAVKPSQNTSSRKPFATLMINCLGVCSCYSHMLPSQVLCAALLPRILSISSHLLISLTKRRWNELTLGLSWNQRSITGQVAASSSQ